MPRFHFPIIDGTRLEDPVGIDLKDADHAKQHAESIARQMPTTKPRHVVAEDANGKEIHRVPIEVNKADA